MKLNEVIQGDCLKIMADIPDGSVDMILCDLPYGSTQNFWDEIIPFEPLWKHYERLIKPDGAIVITAAQPFTSQLVMSNLEWFRYEWIWKKNTVTDFLNANKRPLRDHESILVFFGKAGTYNPQMLKGGKHIRGGKHRDSNNYGAFNDKIYESDEYYPRSVLSIKSDSSRCITLSHRPGRLDVHPTQKPVKLFEYLIRTYTDKGDTVLDNAAGSCTTAIAASNTNRNWICIEQEEKYCELGRARIARETAQGNLFHERKT